MLAFKSLFVSLIYMLVYIIFFSTGSEKVTEAVTHGNVADNFSIEELLNDGSHDLLSANAETLKLRSAWTYEKGPGITPSGSEKRNYGSAFLRDRSRYVCWEITLEHSAASQARDLNFVFSLFDRNGREFTTRIEFSMH